MRHRAKRTREYDSGIQKVSMLLRNMLTSLVLSGKIITTPKRAYMIKAYANHFFANIVRMHKDHDEVYARRESIRRTQSVLFGDSGKKFLTDIVPQLIASDNNSFISDIKLGKRKGDGAEEVLVRIVS